MEKRRVRIDASIAGELKTSRMEAYLSSTKPRHDPAAARTDSPKPALHPSTSHRAASVNPAQGKARPYESLTDAPKAPASLTSKNMVQGGLRDRNKAILKTLGKEDNPITNSTAYSRTMHIQSCATGHQSGGGGKRWTLHRNAKLKLQAAESETQALKGVIAYINGYTGRDVTNTQLKELVERQGGSFVTVASARVTHIFVTENLSAKKAQHYLEARRKNGTKLVTPQWAIACAERGKRVSEVKYAAPVFNELQESTYAFFSRSSTSPAADPPNATSRASPSSPEKRPGVRTRSSYNQAEDNSLLELCSPARRTTPEPVPAPSSVLLPAAPVSPLRRSPRRSPSSTTTTTTTTSATALLLAEIKSAKAQRSPSRSPASKVADRKRGWCATWECVVESPGSRKRRREETRRVEKEKENAASGPAATRSTASRRSKAKPPSAEEVLVLVSSDAEDDSAAGPSPRAAEPPSRSPTSASEAGTDEEEDEWSLPPSAQRR